MKVLIKTTLLLAFSAIFSLQVSAQKFAYVDSEYILSQLPAYKSAQAELNEISKQWQEEIDAQFAEVDKMYKQYQAEKVIMTKDVQTKRENEIIEKERAAKKFQNDKFGYEGELFKKRAELVKPLQDKVYEAINKIAKSNGLDFIFDKSGDMLMLVANSKYDRSGEVLEELGVVSTNGGKDDANLPPGSRDNTVDDLPPR
jgi:outer membrane protein